MATTSHTGLPVVFGTGQPIRSIVNLPPGALKVRLRLRNTAVGKAYVKFPDRVEEWVLGYEGNVRTPDSNWVLLIKTGANGSRLMKL